MEEPTRSMQQEFATWARAELAKQRKTERWLADRMGMDPTAMSRSMSGKRRFTPEDVAFMSLALKKFPPTWNRIRLLSEGSSLLPLMGRVHSGVWCKRGSGMPKGLAPIERVQADDEDGDDQVSYYIETGAHTGQYAIGYRHLKSGIADDDLLIVEEARNFEDQAPFDFVRLTLRRARVREGVTELWPCDGEEEELPPLALPSDRVRVEGRVRWFLIPAKAAAGCP